MSACAPCTRFRLGQSEEVWFPQFRALRQSEAVALSGMHAGRHCRQMWLRVGHHRDQLGQQLRVAGSPPTWRSAATMAIWVLHGRSVCQDAAPPSENHGVV